MENRSAPRKRKRISCELVIDGDSCTGIVIDVSATGLFVQTNAKPDPGSFVQVKLPLSRTGEPVLLEARVARKKLVPAPLLSVARGGVGLAIERAPEAYLDFISEMSPLHAASVEKVRAKRPSRRSAAGAGRARPSGRAGAGGAPAPSRFRIHAVETATGRKSTFLVTCESEQEASDQVSKQLGDEWQVLFIERV